jgi:hypothetical protein
VIRNRVIYEVADCENGVLGGACFGTALIGVVSVALLTSACRLPLARLSSRLINTDTNKLTAPARL